MNKIVALALVGLIFAIPFTSGTPTYNVSYYTNGNTLYITVLGNGTTNQSTASYYVNNVVYAQHNFVKETNFTLPAVSGLLIVTYNGQIVTTQQIKVASGTSPTPNTPALTTLYEWGFLVVTLCIIASALTVELRLKRYFPGEKIKNSYNEDTSSEIKSLKKNAIFVADDNTVKEVYEKASKLMKKYAINPELFDEEKKVNENESEEF